MPATQAADCGAGSHGLLTEKQVMWAADGKQGHMTAECGVMSHEHPLVCWAPNCSSGHEMQTSKTQNADQALVEY